MKILILANDDEGLYQFRRELIISLLEKYDVYAAVPEGPYKQDLENLGIDLTLIRINRHGINPIEDFGLLIRYLKLIRQIDPLLVLTYTIKPNIFGGIICRFLKIPYIVTITGLGTAVANVGLIQKLTLFLYRLSLKKADMVFFQNSENQEFMLEHGIIAGNFELIPGSGVNLNYFEPLKYPRSELVEFSFISRIMKEKGIEQYLEAATYIRSKYPNTRFHVCGYCEQDYLKQLEKLNNEGVIIYHGCVRDVRQIHRQSHCTIHPTYYPEGLSNVLLESLACSRPIITTDRSGCREIVEDHINGFLIKQRDTENLIKAIERFISLPLEKKIEMGVNGRMKVEKEFDRKIVVKKYLSAIDYIIEH